MFPDIDHAQREYNFIGIIGELLQVIFDQIIVTGCDEIAVRKSTCDNTLIHFAQVKVIVGSTVGNSRADLAIDCLIIKLEIICF